MGADGGGVGGVEAGCGEAVGSDLADDVDADVAADEMTVLVPSRPRLDLLAYLASLAITAVYPVGDGWENA